MFPLCKTCADTLNQNPCTHADQERAILGTWCHVELMKAIEKGYEVLKIHEVWHWEQTTDESSYRLLEWGGSDVTTGSVGFSGSFGASDPYDTSGCDVTSAPF